MLNGPKKQRCASYVNLIRRKYHLYTKKSKILFIHTLYHYRQPNLTWVHFVRAMKFIGIAS